MLIGCKVRSHIQVNGSPVPPLRHDPGHTKSETRPANLRQERSEFGGNAWSLLVLKNAGLQHVFQEDTIGNTEWTGAFGGYLRRSLQDQLPSFRKAVVHDCIR